MDTPRAGPEPIHHCEECGYELSGLAEEGACPECGRSFNAWLPFVLRRPVPWLKVAFRMCWPAGLTAAIAIALTKLSPRMPEVGVALPVTFFFWLALAIAVPRGIAQGVSEVRWIRRRRRIPVAALTVAGLILNILLLVGAIWIATRW